MKKVELEIVALSHNITQTHSYAVVLGEVGGMRRLPIVIGGFEAQAIAVALEKMQTSRPLTHDLFTNFMLMFDVELVEVIIYNLDEGIFFAKLVCKHNEELTEIDSRTSDALALAVRMNCKIFTYENILDAAGLYIDQPESSINATGSQGSTPADVNIANEAAQSDSELKDLDIEELLTLLQTVLDQEDYVRAIKIRDEINSRK